VLTNLKGGCSLVQPEIDFLLVEVSHEYEDLDLLRKLSILSLEKIITTSPCETTSLCEKGEAKPQRHPLA